MSGSPFGAGVGFGAAVGWTGGCIVTGAARAPVPVGSPPVSVRESPQAARAPAAAIAATRMAPTIGFGCMTTLMLSQIHVLEHGCTDGRGWGLGQGTLYVELVAQRVVLYLQGLEDPPPPHPPIARLPWSGNAPTPAWLSGRPPHPAPWSRLPVPGGSSSSRRCTSWGTISSSPSLPAATAASYLTSE